MKTTNWLKWLAVVFSMILAGCGGHIGDDDDNGDGIPDDAVITVPGAGNGPPTTVVQPVASQGVHVIDVLQPGGIPITLTMVGDNIDRLIRSDGELEDIGRNNLALVSMEVVGGGTLPATVVSLPLVVLPRPPAGATRFRIVLSDTQNRKFTLNPSFTRVIGGTIGADGIVSVAATPTTVVTPAVTMHRVDVSAPGAIHFALDMVGNSITHRLGVNGPLPDLPASQLALAIIGSDMAGWPEVGGGNPAITQDPPILVFPKSGTGEAFGVFFIDTAGQLSWADPAFIQVIGPGRMVNGLITY